MDELNTGTGPCAPELELHRLNVLRLLRDAENFTLERRRIAARMGANIAFEDEAGVGVMTRHGRTWGMSGETPVIKASMLRGGYNVLCAVTAEGGKCQSTCRL